jgi:uncharacterized membrane-anchored protein
MVRQEVAVVARAVVEQRKVARLTNRAQRLEGAMYRGKRDMRMLLAHPKVNCLGARMLYRSEQRPDNRKPLRRYHQAAFATAPREFGQPLCRISRAASLTEQS